MTSPSVGHTALRRWDIRLPRQDGLRNGLYQQATVGSATGRHLAQSQKCLSEPGPSSALPLSEGFGVVAAFEAVRWGLL